ncbi:Beta-glycosidase (fragment) [Capnocytophaga canimorsus]
MKKFSFLLLGLLALSCSPRYYKKSKNPKKITQRSTQSKHTQKNTSKVEKNHKNDDEEEYLVATSAVEVTPAVIRQYIETYKDISMVEMQRYKIPASITLAQAIFGKW